MPKAKKEGGAMTRSGNIQGTRSLDAEIIQLLIRLVKARSYPGIPQQEKEVVQELDNYLSSYGIETVVTEVCDGRPNLLACVEGVKPGPHLLLCGHTDTVPPNERSPVDLFAAIEKEGRLYGRGTADMKGALAAMAGALVDLKTSGTLTCGKVTLAAIIDEETQTLGSEHLVKSGFKADASIVGEPTNNEIDVGHKGLEWLVVEFEGKAAHGGTPESGINAISAAAHFVQLVEKELIPEFRRRRDAILGLPAINIGTIQGGDQPSTVAAHCQIKLDRRWVNTETIEQVFEDLEILLEKIRFARPGLKTNVFRVPDSMATMLHGPVTIDAGHPVVLAAQNALREHDLTAEPLGIFPAWTDAALISREAKIPSIIWGPGELNYAHSPEENIKLEDVILAKNLYAFAALSFTGSLAQESEVKNT
jgi:acetylornithine deacetylase/succinyl-diaminopimelate desuccinylase family protein